MFFIHREKGEVGRGSGRTRHKDRLTETTVSIVDEHVTSECFCRVIVNAARSIGHISQYDCSVEFQSDIHSYSNAID